MATGLLAQYQAAVNNADFDNRITMAICAAAQAIAAEATTVIDHTNRVALAKAVALAPASYTRAFALMLAAQGIDNGSLDSDITNMVSAVWNTLAGVV